MNSQRWHKSDVVGGEDTDCTWCYWCRSVWLDKCKNSMNHRPSARVTSLLFQVTYCGLNVQVLRGNQLSPGSVDEEPCIVSWPAYDSSLYTLLMVDAHAASSALPSAGHSLHWLVMNIHGCNVTSGNTITPYYGSYPPRNTGFHRYIFLAFLQARPIKLDRSEFEYLSVNRVNFSTRNFTKQNDLGDPVAGNFYLTGE